MLRDMSWICTAFIVATEIAFVHIAELALSHPTRCNKMQPAGCVLRQMAIADAFVAFIMVKRARNSLPSGFTEMASIKIACCPNGE